ncbi:MAG: HlyD family secretion protein [Candidatus Aminicenantaceae bacterium]
MRIRDYNSTCKRRSKKPIIGIVSWFLAIVVALNLTGCQKEKPASQESQPAMDFTPKQVVGLGRIEPEMKILSLNSETSGIVTRIIFQPGSFVAKGEIIVELSNAIEKARLEQAEAKVKSQISRIEAARAELASIKIKTENAKITFERAKTLYEQDAETKFNYDRAKTEYESLVEDVKRLEAGVVAAQNLLKQCQADHRLAKAEYDRKFIKALTEGRLLSLDITLGSLVSPDKPFGTFAPKSPLVARCEIDEMFAAEVSLGQKAYVRNPGMTDTLAWGQVSFVGPYLRKKSIFSDEVGDLEDRRVREIWINLDPDAKLLYGTRVECVVILKR